jgi:hypothetical protein
MKINEGQANAITCMAYKCNTKLDETLIPKYDFTSLPDQ